VMMSIGTVLRQQLRSGAAQEAARRARTD
jgi:hypothetical protein